MSNQDEKNAMLQGEIDNLNQKVAFLEQKLKELQENRSIPTSPWTVYGPIVERRCTKCGLKLDGPMGYCCSNSDCPSGLGPVMCKTS